MSPPHYCYYRRTIYLYIRYEICTQCWKRFESPLRKLVIRAPPTLLQYLLHHEGRSLCSSFMKYGKLNYYYV